MDSEKTIQCINEVMIAVLGLILSLFFTMNNLFVNIFEFKSIGDVIKLMFLFYPLVMVMIFAYLIQKYHFVKNVYVTVILFVMETIFVAGALCFAKFYEPKLWFFSIFYLLVVLAWTLTNLFIKFLYYSERG